MKLQSIELPIGKLQSTITKILILLTLSLLLAIGVPLYNSFLAYPPLLLTTTTNDDPSSSSSFVGNEDECDMFSGEWVPNPEAPYYTNSSCWAIHEHQNCMKYGRPDTEYLKWKWQPYGCDLPLFDPAQFLELVRDKSMAFVGDSVGRNQMQSMICLLSRIEFPEDISVTPDDYFRRWNYTSYNFTLVTYWTPHLVRTNEADPNGPSHTGLFNLYLDEPDHRWSHHIAGLDYIILNAGHWFYRPMMYYENNLLVGCHACFQPNTTDLPKYYGYRKAFRTAFRAINDDGNNFEGMVILRTFAPSHFENGLWNEGGDCVRKSPLRTNETVMEGIDLEFHEIQMEEFKAAERKGTERGLRYRLLDTTQAMLMRPDGHPSKYGHSANASVTLYNDCVHWCLPGPIDTMSDFLLQILKMEGRRSYE